MLELRVPRNKTNFLTTQQMLSMVSSGGLPVASTSRDRILAFIRERILAGVPPSIREVQEHLGFKNVRAAQEQIERLLRDGLLERQEGVARGLRLPQANRPGSMAHIPILGRVQAGALQPAVEDIEGYLPLRASAKTPLDLFALRVRGESMRDAHILPDDLVVVRRQPTAENGQIVVALVEDEATVKIFQRRGRKVELHPANPDFSIIRPDPEHLTLLGRVIEVRRSLE